MFIIYGGNKASRNFHLLESHWYGQTRIFGPLVLLKFRHKLRVPSFSKFNLILSQWTHFCVIQIKNVLGTGEWVKVKHGFILNIFVTCFWFWNAQVMVKSVPRSSWGWWRELHMGTRTSNVKLAVQCSEACPMWRDWLCSAVLLVLWSNSKTMKM